MTNISTKFFILTFCIITTQLHASAPLTKENLHRRQHGLPLLPDFAEQKKRRALTRQQQYDVGVTYLRNRKIKNVEQQINKMFATLQTFYNARNQKQFHTSCTHYEQEKLHRTDIVEIETSSSQNYLPIHKYQEYRQSRKKS